MPRKDVEFKTSDGVTLRGWLYTSESITGKAPCIVMCSGIAGIKEIRLDAFAEFFVAKLPISCLVYDHRGWGGSDVAVGQPRNETIPMTQCSDMSDAISYAIGCEDVDPTKIGIWGSSYAGGHALYVGAVDRRVKAVLSSVPLVSGWASMERSIPSSQMGNLTNFFANDRSARAQGAEPSYIPVVDKDPAKSALFSSLDCVAFFERWIDSKQWQNRITVKSMESVRGYEPQQLIDKISPTPLLMTVALQDTIAHTDLALRAFSKALEPKQLCTLDCGHFDAYYGANFEKAAAAQVDFIKTTMCTI